MASKQISPFLSALITSEILQLHERKLQVVFSLLEEGFGINQT